MIKPVTRGGPGKDTYYREFILTSADDAANLPNSQSPVEERATAGSTAFLQDLSKTYLLGPDDVWREV